MAKVLIPIPHRDFDPSEVAIGWNVLKRFNHSVAFATPDGKPGAADDLMLTGEGLDIWGFIPGVRHLVAIGRLMRANADARRAYAALEKDPAFAAPLKWADVRREDFDGLLLPGGHRARGMRDYLESEILQRLVAEFFAANVPVAAICHGVLLAARSHAADGRSVLNGRRTTALTWSFEHKAEMVGRVVRFWDPHYYRTYLDAPDHRRKTDGLTRDTFDDERPAFVVRDGNYVSARWPGDAHTFAKTFAAMLAERRRDVSG